jgi:hypothetical protein
LSTEITLLASTSVRAYVPHGLALHWKSGPPSQFSGFRLSTVQVACSESSLRSAFDYVGRPRARRTQSGWGLPWRYGAPAHGEPNVDAFRCEVSVGLREGGYSISPEIGSDQNRT